MFGNLFKKKEKIEGKPIRVPDIKTNNYENNMKLINKLHEEELEKKKLKKKFKK